MMMTHKKFVKLLIFILLLLVKKLEKTLNLMILPPSHFLIHQLHSFFFFPATSEEIYLLIGDIKTKKAVKRKRYKQ